MKINLSLNPKSIKEAQKKLKELKKKILLAYEDFLIDVSKWIIERANQYVDMSDIGSLVKSEIKSSWTYEKTPTGIKITNTAQKSVFVEFGVGIVGQENSHPNASVEAYQYNIPTESKDSSGMWYFWTNSNELDLPLSSVEDIRGYDDHRGRRGKRIIFGTRGAQGVMYAYNAIVDARNEISKSNGGEIGALWQQAKARYIG